MKVKILLNGTMREAEISSDQLLIDFVRDHGCYSVKRGCETSNCGLCTVFVDDKPVLSCSMLTARVDGCKVDTLEGLQEEAKEFGAFVADQGAEQCGFCNPGMIMNAIAMFRENPEPTREEIKAYLAEIFADVPDMKDSFVQWKHLSNTERKEKDHESSRTTDKKKRCNGTGDRKTGIHG